MSDTLSIWAVTFNSLDIPGKYVAREHVVGFGMTDNLHIADTLDDVRDMLPRGLINIGRAPTDDALIVESWI